MRSGDFFAVFCIESNIGPATRNKEKSHSNPSLNIAVKIWKCVEVMSITPEPNLTGTDSSFLKASYKKMSHERSF